MKEHAYCYARCNRAKRRLCKKDCPNDVIDSPVERGLLDIETYYGAARKAESNVAWIALLESDDGRRCSEVMSLWLTALGTDGHMTVPPSWRKYAADFIYWNPRSLFYHWKDDVKWFNETKDEAVANGLDSMLEAYYSGVPFEDIVA